MKYCGRSSSPSVVSQNIYYYRGMFVILLYAFNRNVCGLDARNVL